MSRGLVTMVAERFVSSHNPFHQESTEALIYYYIVYIEASNAKRINKLEAEYRPAASFVLCAVVLYS